MADNNNNNNNNNSNTEVDSSKAIPVLQKSLVSQDEAIEKRFRSLFTLRSIGSVDSIDAMASGKYQ